ncbi:MAG TPA: SpoIIE family protein phosphatase, partial [Blastocatellia bacterium]|nr:SpoIIE family protein phosphatase [Blastocatellia bacterium]
MTRRLQFIIGGLFFTLLFVFTGTNIYSTFSAPPMQSDPGWMTGRVNNRIIIRQVPPDGSAFPLRQGDELVSLNGRQITEIPEIIAAFQDIYPDTYYSIAVRRAGQLQEYRLKAKNLSLSQTLLNPARIVITAIFLITGFAVFLLKPFDKQAVLLALMFGMFIAAPSAAFFQIAPGTPAGLRAIIVAAYIGAIFFWPVFFHFFLIFPEPSPLLRRFPKLEYHLYIPHLLTIFPFLAFGNIVAAFAPASAAQFRERSAFLALTSFVMGVLYITGGFLSLLVNYRLAGRPSRQKLRVVVAGSIAGFMPLFVVGGLAFLIDQPWSNPTISRWLLFIALISFPLFPLSFAYAIIRHQVIPVRLILRRGVRYLLVSRGFVIVQAIFVFAVLSFILTGSRMESIDRFGNRADIVVTILATGLAIGVLTLVNQRMMPIIDRRFFREAYDAQQLISDLGQEMRTVTAVDQLLKQAIAKIQLALHTENATVFLRDDASGDYVCALSWRLNHDNSTSDEVDRNILFPHGGYIARQMGQSPLPLIVDLQERISWSKSKAASSEQAQLVARERAALRRLNSVLLVPFATKDQLLGIISLGPRLGDLPFSREDKQLLMAVAWQLAFAIQNARLVQEVAEEERLRHELKIATEVQQRLFPQVPPLVEHLELCGVCHPARGVGGDYYDFIELGRGKIGIAVADVAGKGMSAALLMSTVQASLRSQAPSVNGNLTQLVSSMNKLLHGSTGASSYATFFYAQFDEQTNLLTYINAGHNPPMLARANSIIKAQTASHSLSGAGEHLTTRSELRAENGKREITL